MDGTLTSVKNGLRILRLFSVDVPELGITEISRLLRLHKTTVHRLITILEEGGFVEKNQKNRKYRLSLPILHLSGIVELHTEMFKEAIPILQYLANKVGEAVHLSILEDDRVVYLHKIECQHPVRLLSYVGRSNPCSCTSSGKAILAFRTKAMIENILHQGLPKCGPNSVTDPKLFLEQLTDIRSKGYAVCIDELHEGATSIAAPIRDYSGEVVAAVSVVGPNQRVTPVVIPQFIQFVCQAAHEISSLLGYCD